MRRVRYSVAASLDGYITGPNGEIDWIIMDPEIDFAAIFAEFDTVLMGRGSYQPASQPTSSAEGGPDAGMFGMKTYVFSRTLRQADHPEVTIVGDDYRDVVAGLRAGTGKDIWLFGGGTLFRSLLEAGLVDGVEVAVMPVLVGGGVPLLPGPAKQARLELTKHKVYKSGIVGLEYRVK